MTDLQRNRFQHLTAEEAFYVQDGLLCELNGLRRMKRIANAQQDAGIQRAIDLVWSLIEDLAGQFPEIHAFVRNAQGELICLEPGNSK